MTLEVFAPRSASPNGFRLGHLPQVFSPLQSITERARQASLSRPGRSPGVRSPSAHDVRPEPTSPGLASPGTLRLQAFAASWRLASPDASRPCFMPVTPMGFLALQSFSPSSSRNPSRGHVALLPFTVAIRLGFRAFSPESGSVVRVARISDATRARCSPGLLAPPGSSPLPRWLPLRVASSPGLHPGLLGRPSNPGLPSRVSFAGESALALSSPPTLLGSPASSFPSGVPAVRRGLRP